MRTRWDEVEEVDGGSHRFLGLSAVTWGISVPVAFIAGAAVMSYFDQSRMETSALTIPAPAISENHKPATESRVSTDKGRWEEEARLASAKAAELQMQVEALRDQVSDEARRRQQAEQAADQKASELASVQQRQSSAENKPAAPVSISSRVQPAQDPLAYAAPAAEPTIRPQAEAQPSMSAAARTSQQDSGASNDSMALQRIIEDTASRSAALSDRRDEAEGETTSSASISRPQSMPRRLSDVETALERATGLDTLSAPQRNGLKEELVAGACVTVSLEKVFGSPVPVVPLRNLVRDLDSDC